VWLAKDETTGLDVALKIIPREGKAAARAEREALAARRLRHERCVRAYDVGHDNGHVYIAYEYVPGHTMRQALRAGGISDLDAVEIGAQVLEALAHAHRAGIVHRDVKPSNILLEHGDPVGARLLDFGLAQFDGADTLTAVGDVPGTLAYIAPERLGGEEATPASDVWAVGVVLWEALGSRHPFWGMPLQQVALAIEQGAPPLATERRDLPRRLLAAVDRALSPDPARRPRASELATELRRALQSPQRKAGRRPTPEAPRNQASESALPAARLLERAVPALLAGAAAAVGVTILPFWPPALAVAIVLGVAAAAAVQPRLGLALALATPVFPLGNVTQGLAILYGAIAVAWLVLHWREARLGLLFVAGPLLTAIGALGLVPLAVQPLRSPLRRGLQAAAAVLLAGGVAALSDDPLPVGGRTLHAPDLAPGSSLGDVTAAMWGSLSSQPVLLAAAVLAAGVAVAVPYVRRRSRLGVAALGILVVVTAGVAGAGPASIVVLTMAWSVAAVLAARPAD
jgi:serine/threonine-protein kinase